MSSSLPPGGFDPAQPHGEASLVAALCAGDEKAFEVLVRREGARLLAIARRILRQDEEAKDAVQEAFIAAYRAIGDFDQGSLLSTWLHRIVVNCALMRIRARDRHPEQPIDDLLPAFLEDGHQANPAKSWAAPADRILESRQNRELVRASIDRLPESYRNVLLLRDIEEMSTEETALAMGLTPNAVKIRLHRARQALRGLLDPHFRRGAG